MTGLQEGLEPAMPELAIKEECVKAYDVGLRLDSLPAPRKWRPVGETAGVTLTRIGLRRLVDAHRADVLGADAEGVMTTEVTAIDAVRALSDYGTRVGPFRAHKISKLLPGNSHWMKVHLERLRGL